MLLGTRLNVVGLREALTADCVLIATRSLPSIMKFLREQVQGGGRKLRLPNTPYSRSQKVLKNRTVLQPQGLEKKENQQKSSQAYIPTVVFSTAPPGTPTWMIT